MPVATMDSRPAHSSSSIHLHTTHALPSSSPANHSPTGDYSPPLSPPAREFLVNVDMWCTFSSLKASKKAKSQRPSSTIALSSTAYSQDDLALAHSLSATTDSYSNTHTFTSTTSSIINAASGAGAGIGSGAGAGAGKKGISSIFSGSSSGLSDVVATAGHAVERAAKAGAAGFWKSAVCKLSGEGGVWPGHSQSPTGSALLTLYSASDNTLQHVIHIHKLTSTDVRPVDKSLFGRSDVLAIWSHPEATSLSTHSTLDPIYLSFSSPDAHNTWLVLLRSYTNPEIYGKMIEGGRAQGGLYRMWRQIELVVVQSRGVGLSPPNTSTIGTGGVPTTLQPPSKEKRSLGTFFSSSANKDDPVRPVTAPAFTGSTISTGEPLALTMTQGTAYTGTTASYTSTTASFTSGTESTSSFSESFAGDRAAGTRGRSGDATPLATGAQTPIAAGTGGGITNMTSPSSASLPTSEGDASSTHGGAPTNAQRPASGSKSNANPGTKREEERRREKEAKEREKERERKEKERREKERERERERKRLPGFFAEVVLDSEIAGRTTVRKPPSLPTNSGPSSRSGMSTPIPSQAQTLGASATAASAAGPEWFESFLFPDLPSFGNLKVAVWKIERSKDGEKEKDKTKGPASPTTLNTVTGNGSTISGLTSTTIQSGKSSGTAKSATSIGPNGKGVGGPTIYGGAKGTQFLGCVEISVPNFRRGEWVEGWWPVYCHANSLGGESKGNTTPSGIAGLNIGSGAVGIGGMSGVGGAGGAMVQVGELKLKIKVDEEIILPSKAYKNVLDALEQRNYLDVLSDLEQKMRIDNSMISHHIVSLAVARNRLLKDIVQLAEREISTVSGSTNTLFRGNTVLTKTMELAMAWYGRGFLDATVGPIVRRMIAENVEIEVDPSKLPASSRRPSTKDSHRPSTRDSHRPGTRESALGDDKESLQEQGIRLLEHWCNEFWSHIYLVRMECPVELRRLFGHIRLMVERRFGVAGRMMDIEPDDPNGGFRNVVQGADMLPWQAISSFVFLRFIVPAILHPHLFGICQGMPNRGVVRSLTLLAKCTQSLANLNPGAPQKEEYMRGIRGCLERNTVTMIDYLACVSSLPDQFSPTANSSSFLSGPDKHDRLHVINSLRERLTGAGGSSIPTLYKDAIPLLPYALDVPKHLAILSSTVVRNARSGGNVYGPRTGSAGAGAEDTGAWSLNHFSELCFDVEAQALKSVATLAQGAASAGAFAGTRMKRSTSASSSGGFQPRPNSSRGLTPTGPNAGGSSMATTPTQGSPAPRPIQARRPPSSRSITTPTKPPQPSTSSPAPSPGGLNVPSDSSRQESAVKLVPTNGKRQSLRPSTAPSSTSAGSSPSEAYYRERDRRAKVQPDMSPAAGSFRYLPPDQQDRRTEATPPQTPISAERSSYSSGSRRGYPAMHHGESEGYVPYHYPSRYQGSAEALRANQRPPSATEKSERRSSSSRLKDLLRRPATSSGSPSASVSASEASQRTPWTWEQPSTSGAGERSPHSSSVDDVFGPRPHSKRGGGGLGSSGASSADVQGVPPQKAVKRTDTATSGEQKKKKGLFGWLKK